MGDRGPKSTPNVIKLLRGNPGKRPLNLSDGINPPIATPSPPDWLSPQSKKEWRRISAELEELGLISEIDKASLSTYCQTWGDLCELERAMASKRRKVMGQTAKDELAEKLGDMYFWTTPTGFQRESALHRKIVEMRSELDRYVKNFGLNPSARARVTPSSNVQLDLPGIQAVATGFARFTQGGNG